jgi:hypothetical protein
MRTLLIAAMMVALLGICGCPGAVSNYGLFNFSDARPVVKNRVPESSYTKLDPPLCMRNTILP